MPNSTPAESSLPAPRPVVVWDVPTRLMHWLLAAGFLAAFLLAEARGGFVIHVIVGLMVALVAVLRILWGLVGTRYARFASLSLRPGALVGYLRGAVGRSVPATIHHNPATAYVTVLTLLAALGLTVSGVLITRGVKVAKEVHELLVAVVVVSAALHLLGLVWHAWRHRDGAALSMFHGRKAGAPADAIPSSRPAIGAVLLLVVAAWVGLLVSQVDGQTGALRLPGLGWTIGAREDHHGEHGDQDEHRRRGGRHHDHEDHHDDD